MNITAALEAVEQAVAEKKLSASARVNLQAWLTEPRFADYVPPIVEHIAQSRWKELDDVFWTVIPFGTAGRRGKMYPFGSNAINDRTIGESAQGLADYVKQQQPTGPWGCAIAYDTRINSRHFAELCASILTANGFRVYFLDGYRSTPELSFTVRMKQCITGIMVTASHNPPSDNAVKVYWCHGEQLLPPHDKGVIDAVGKVQGIQKLPFTEAVEQGKVVLCQQEVDAAYNQAVLAQSTPGPRAIKIIYSSMHGVGRYSVMPILAQAGFQDVELYGPCAEPDGQFPNVPGHVSNPENPPTFDGPIARAKEIGADIVISTDPDADRLGVAAPLNKGGEWRTFTGNQIGVLLADYALERRGGRAGAKPGDYVVKTLVTTDMVRRIADSYGVRTCGNLHVGYKYIAQAIDAEGPNSFVYACEESHGYLVGQYARDKDGNVACLLMAELAAKVKAAGQTLHEKLDSLYWQHGCHVEQTINRMLPGSQGMELMRQLMATLRTTPPRTLGGLKVVRVRDYLNRVQYAPGGTPEPLEAPQGDMVMFDLEAEGNYVAVRPSGTEPKVKFYCFAYESAEQLHNLDATKQALNERIAAVAKDLMQAGG